MKSIIRRASILFLSVLLTAAMLCGMTVSAVDTTDRGVRLYRGTFFYPGNKDIFYYDDSFFNISADKENEHLRTISAAMAFSASGNSAQNTVDLLTDIGMDQQSMAVEEMVQGTRDTIGTVIAHKICGDETLVAVVIRGNEYDGEWANNVIAGQNGDAAGLREAADKVAVRLKAYLSANEIGHAKIWVCGFSRAGGIADLLGCELNRSSAAYATEKDNIYVYTFEAPRCNADDTVYENIRNITDINDLIPHLYPESWGLYLNGVTEKIGDPEKTVTAKYFNLFAQGYVKEIGQRQQSKFLDGFEELLGTAVSREFYATTVEETISELCAIYFGKNDDDRKALQAYLEQVGSLAQEDPDFNAAIWSMLLDPESETNINTFSTLVSKWLDEAKASQNPPLTDEECAALQDSVRPLATLALTLVNADKEYTESDENGKKVRYTMYHLITFFNNLTDIIEAHMPHSVFEQLKKSDSYYTAGVRIKPGDVIIGQNRYAFDENGWPLEDIVRASGFSDEDIAIWKNGYELRINNEMTEITEPDRELYLKASGKFDKSMSMYKFYELAMTKTVGFRTYPIDPSIKLKDNPICLTIPQEIAKKCVRYGVARVDDYGSYKLDTEIVKLDNGDVQLWVNGVYPAVYACAIDDRRWCTSADVDWDDIVSTMDVTHIQRYLASLENFDNLQKTTSDVDSDGETTVMDSTWILRYLARQDVPYAIGEKLEITEE